MTLVREAAVAPARAVEDRRCPNLPPLALDLASVSVVVSSHSQVWEIAGERVSAAAPAEVNAEDWESAGLRPSAAAAAEVNAEAMDWERFSAAASWQRWWR